ncbi:ATP-binding protein [Streptomyces sp. J15]|uniref:ATP-binding protein n=1 Tax=Streptomyces pakalii TaxID=3036494 RepID=A0ABT7D651_9ACTN|nr:ATP-binding protein [Streptomyces pakalii]
MCSELDRRPAVAVITGEPGVGKSRFVHELLRRTTAPDAVTLLARCQEADTSFPFAPLVEALNRFCSGPLPADLPPVTGALHALLPDLADRLPPAPPALGDPRAEHRRVLRALHAYTAALGDAVLVVEDLQMGRRVDLRPPPYGHRRPACRPGPRPHRPHPYRPLHRCRGERRPSVPAARTGPRDGGRAAPRSAVGAGDRCAGRRAARRAGGTGRVRRPTAPVDGRSAVRRRGGDARLAGLREVPHRHRGGAAAARVRAPGGGRAAAWPSAGGAAGGCRSSGPRRTRARGTAAVRRGVGRAGDAWSTRGGAEGRGPSRLPPRRRVRLPLRPGAPGRVRGGRRTGTACSAPACGPCPGPAHESLPAVGDGRALPACRPPRGGGALP